MGVFPKTEFSQNGGEGSNGGVVVVVAVLVGAVGDDRSFVRSAFEVRRSRQYTSTYAILDQTEVPPRTYSARERFDLTHCPWPYIPPAGLHNHPS